MMMATALTLWLTSMQTGCAHNENEKDMIQTKDIEVRNKVSENLLRGTLYLPGQRNGANPVGNIKGDPCLGYFTAASVTHADTLVFSYDGIRTAR